MWSVYFRENNYNCCHQMSSFKAKMHQIRFRLRLRPRPRWGSFKRSPGSPSWILGVLLLKKVRGEEERRTGKGEGGKKAWRGRTKKGREERGRETRTPS